MGSVFSGSTVSNFYLDASEMKKEEEKDDFDRIYNIIQDKMKKADFKNEEFIKLMSNPNLILKTVASGIEDSNIFKKDDLISLKIAFIKTKEDLTWLQKTYLNLSGNMPQYGGYHTAIFLGSKWLIDWVKVGNTDDGIVFVKKIEDSSKLIFLYDLKYHYQDKCPDFTFQMNFKQKYLPRLFNTMMKWNTKMKYVSYGGNSITTGNCQDFIDDLYLNMMGHKLDFKGRLIEHFINDLKSVEGFKIKLPATLKMKELLNVDKEIIFKSHKELDIFCKKHKDLIKKWENGEFQCEEFDLLKGYDRGFWSRYLKFSLRLAKESEDLQKLKSELSECKNTRMKQEITTKIEVSQKKILDFQKIVENSRPLFQNDEELENNLLCVFDSPIIKTYHDYKNRNLI